MEGLKEAATGKQRWTNEQRSRWMRWGSVMTGVCYDGLNQVPFDKTVLTRTVFIASAVSPSTKAG